MQLLDHVSIAVPDMAQARPFYDAIMQALGAPKVYDRPDALGYGERCRAGDDAHTFLAVYQRAGAVPAHPGSHWCFKAPSREAVRAFHAAGLAHGGRDDGAPGLRHYHPHYYGAFVTDPAGNRLEAVCNAAE